MCEYMSTAVELIKMSVSIKRVWPNFSLGITA